jgi:hypothetical protein
MLSDTKPESRASETVGTVRVLSPAATDG